jgi:hypothetical protein
MMPSRCISILRLGFGFLSRRSDREGLIVLRPLLLLPEVNDSIDLGLGHECAVHADQARRSGRKPPAPNGEL